jgi:hypothetical protein
MEGDSADYCAGDNGSGGTPSVDGGHSNFTDSSGHSAAEGFEPTAIDDGHSFTPEYANFTDGSGHSAAEGFEPTAIDDGHSFTPEYANFTDSSGHSAAEGFEPTAIDDGHSFTPEYANFTDGSGHAAAEGFEPTAIDDGHSFTPEHANFTDSSGHAAAEGFERAAADEHSTHIQPAHDEGHPAMGNHASPGTPASGHHTEWEVQFFLEGGEGAGAGVHAALLAVRPRGIDPTQQSNETAFFVYAGPSLGLDVGFPLSVSPGWVPFQTAMPMEINDFNFQPALIIEPHTAGVVFQVSLFNYFCLPLAMNNPDQCADLSGLTYGLGASTMISAGALFPP